MFFRFSYITQASFSEFVTDSHYYTSPNRQYEPPTVPFSDSGSLLEKSSPTLLRRRLWALHHSPYLPFILNSPFHGSMTSCLANPPEQIPLEHDESGFHLSANVAESWNTLEQTCYEIAVVLRSSFQKAHRKVYLTCSIPTNPSQFGYLTTHTTEEKARSALSESLDAFVVLLAYVSFCIAICRVSSDPKSISMSTKLSKQPMWFRDLVSRKSGIRPEWHRILANSPVADFSPALQRRGVIINVARCSWLYLLPYMLNANVPIWLYWGVPPALGQPLYYGALIYAPRSHPQFRAHPQKTTPSQSHGRPVRSGYAGRGHPATLPERLSKSHPFFLFVCLFIYLSVFVYKVEFL